LTPGIQQGKNPTRKFRLWTPIHDLELKLGNQVPIFLDTRLHIFFVEDGIEIRRPAADRPYQPIAGKIHLDEAGEVAHSWPIADLVEKNPSAAVVWHREMKHKGNIQDLEEDVLKFAPEENEWLNDCYSATPGTRGGNKGWKKRNVASQFKKDMGPKGFSRSEAQLAARASALGLTFRTSKRTNETFTQAEDDWLRERLDYKPKKGEPSRLTAFRSAFNPEIKKQQLDRRVTYLKKLEEMLGAKFTVVSRYSKAEDDWILRVGPTCQHGTRVSKFEKKFKRREEGVAINARLTWLRKKERERAARGDPQRSLDQDEDGDEDGADDGADDDDVDEEENEVDDREDSSSLSSLPSDDEEDGHEEDGDDDQEEGNEDHEEESSSLSSLSSREVNGREDDGDEDGEEDEDDEETDSFDDDDDDGADYED